MPDAAALIEGNRLVSWRELDLNLNTNRLANGLTSLGSKKDTRVATVIRNGTAAVEMIFALVKGGLQPLPINYGLTPAEIAVALDDSICERTPLPCPINAVMFGQKLSRSDAELSHATC